jgi:uncharacterized protein YdhG (YjbR/CyaY superfamily)
MDKGVTPSAVDAYIEGCAPDVRKILQRIRRTIRRAAPGARETISYRMPTFMLNGVIVHFAAFKEHIGLFPPVKGNGTLEKAVARYAGPKGNLRFPLDQPIPYALIDRIARFRVKQNRARISNSSSRQTKRRSSR